MSLINVLEGVLSLLFQAGNKCAMIMHREIKDGLGKSISHDGLGKVHLPLPAAG